MKIEHILIVADDSPPSVNAIQYGFNLARDLGARVTLLSVIERITAGNPDAGIFPDDAAIAHQAKTDAFLNRMKDEHAKNVNTEVLISHGDILTEIMDAAHKINPDLIIAGTHSRTGLNKLLRGSIAESIIHRSPVPVCIVPMAK